MNFVEESEMRGRNQTSDFYFCRKQENINFRYLIWLGMSCQWTVACSDDICLSMVQVKIIFTLFYFKLVYFFQTRLIFYVCSRLVHFYT